MGFLAAVELGMGEAARGEGGHAQIVVAQCVGMVEDVFEDFEALNWQEAIECQACGQRHQLGIAKNGVQAVRPRDRHRGP